MARTSSISSPGSMTMASCVVSSPMTEQLHCSGPTGRILWIMHSFSLRLRVSTTIGSHHNISRNRSQLFIVSELTYNSADCRGLLMSLHRTARIAVFFLLAFSARSEEHTSELQSLR